MWRRAEDAERMAAARRLARLTALKDRYDPGSVLHLNHNIPPTPRASPACANRSSLVELTHPMRPSGLQRHEFGGEGLQE